MHRSFHRSTLAVALASFAVSLSACSSDAPNPSASQAGQKPVVVEVMDMMYMPANVTIKAGQTVEWKFDDGGVPHDVHGDDGIDSKLLTTGTYSHTFAKPGTYNYLCTVHAETMKGQVIVK